MKGKKMDYDYLALDDLNISLKDEFLGGIAALLFNVLVGVVIEKLENAAYFHNEMSNNNDAFHEQNKALKKLKEQITKKMDDLFRQAKEEREGYSKYPVLLPPDGEETHYLDIDYWTRGRVSKIYAQLPDMDEVRNGSLNRLSQSEISNLLELIKKVNKNMKNEIEEICVEAGFNFVCSCERRNMGRLIQQQLTRYHGWSMRKGIDQGFVDRDPRNEVQFELVNPAGDQMSVRVSSIQNNLRPEVYVWYGTFKPVSKDYQNAILHTMESVFQKCGIPIDSFIFT